MKKILFVVPLYKDRSPSQRFRFEQYLNFFYSKGFDCEISNLITPKTDKIFYSKGNLFKKLILLLKFLAVRFKDVYKAAGYDLIFVQREAFFIGTTFFEKRFSKKTKLIFDFDDAIWLPNVSPANKNMEWLKNYNKTTKIIAYAHHVIAGNKYLANYAKKNNPNVTIIPTTIDVNEYKAQRVEKIDKVIIGWSGSITTIQHFEYAVAFLKVIKDKYQDKIAFKVMGDKQYVNKELKIKGIAWNKQTEISELSTFDIGIMPLPDDEWAKGKCGLKGLQYMALEIPTIMSPVGVNTEIINDGVNGFLASTQEEWIEKISMLVENPELRKKLGQAGRRTVVEKYSVEANKEKYLAVLEKTLAS